MIGKLEVGRGAVFYLCGENPDDVRMRWIALAKEMGFDADTIDVHFFDKRFKISEKYHELVAEAHRLIPTVIAEHLSESAQEEIAKTARSHEDQLLGEIDKDGRASLAKFAERCGWAYGKSGDPNKTLVRRTLDKLKEQNLIAQDRDGYKLTDKGQKALKKSQEGRQTKANGHASTGGQRTARDPLKVVGDCPQNEKCALCLDGSNGKKGVVQKISLNRAGATPLSLHRECAERWFHVGDKNARNRSRYPRD